VYWSRRRLLELMVLRRRSEREKEIEILLLRHQLRVLERQVARPALTPADRALLAAFCRVPPRAAWKTTLFVTPATLMRWHRELWSPAAGRIRIGGVRDAHRPAPRCVRSCCGSLARTRAGAIGVFRANWSGWGQARREHRLDDSEGGGDRAGAEAARAELERVPAGSGGEHLGVRLAWGAERRSQPTRLTAVGPDPGRADVRGRGLEALRQLSSPKAETPRRVRSRPTGDSVR
jgi:hypothetical protein